MSTVYTMSALLHLSDLATAGPAQQGRYDLIAATGSDERRDALLIENIYRRDRASGRLRRVRRASSPARSRPG